MRPSSLILLLLAPSLMIRAEGLAPDARFVSGPERVELIELFTSEGCSSCPPADRWLTSLKREDDLFTEFVPVAYHVDYWDYIGWKDRFAQPAFTTRQRRYAQEGGARVIYTPGMFLDGADWTGWRGSNSAIDNDEQVGSLLVELRGDTVDAAFTPQTAVGESMNLTVAVLGMNRLTAVEAGENVGKILRHDFVVLELVNTRLEQAGDVLAGRVSVNAELGDGEDLAIAAWVSRGNTQAPLQATGGYLSPPRR